MREDVCQKCNGTGWITIKRDDKEFVKKCGCLKIDIMLTKAEKANIPQRFVTAKLEHYYPDENCPSQGIAKKKVEEFIDDYPSVKGGLLLQGSIGLGKTFLLCIIAAELMEKFNNIDIYYIDWNDLLREMRSGEGHATRDFSAIHQLINKLVNVDLLLFDELGASGMSPWVFDNIYYLFNKRYNNQKVTVCASNYLDKSLNGQETLNQRIGERIRSRLFEMTEVVEIYGKDMRKEYK